jgi:hypothetical protein
VSLDLFVDAAIGLVKGMFQGDPTVFMLRMVILIENGLGSDTAGDLASFVPPHSIAHDQEVSTALTLGGVIAYPVAILIDLTFQANIRTSLAAHFHEMFCSKYQCANKGELLEP